MPTKIGPNNANLYSGIVFVILYPVFLFIFLYVILPGILADFHRAGFRLNMLPFAIIPIFFVYVAIRFIPKFFAMPFWVVVDDDLKTLEFKYLLKKPQIIRREHIVSYEAATVTVKSRSGATRYPGFVLQLLDGIKVMASERGLSDIFYITSMLDYWSVKKPEGEEEYEA